MENLTRRGIALDLEESPYRYQVRYGDSSCVTYVFSSGFYLENFGKKVETNRLKINDSLSKRFGFAVKYNLLCDLRLYSSIEKRGFLIYRDGKRIECLNNLILDGENVIKTI